jgi:hypothetical protein
MRFLACSVHFTQWNQGQGERKGEGMGPGQQEHGRERDGGLRLRVSTCLRGKTPDYRHCHISGKAKKM